VTADDQMTIVAARALGNNTRCFVGIGLPSVAANLARRLHAPQCVLIYESGTIGAKPARLPLSIGDGELADTADSVVSVPEIFNYWLQAGRIDVGFLGAAQIDRFGRINTTVLGGDYNQPQVRLPGAGGAPEIAASCRQVIVILRQSPRAFVDAIDFVTTASRPERVITDLGVLEPNQQGELVLTALHPGVAVDTATRATGWPLKAADPLGETAPPTTDELTALRALQAASR
jgi:glutaconate CoA-transferase subunit B